MTNPISEDRLLAAISSLELNLSRQLTSEIRALEMKLEEKVGRREFDLLADQVREIREHGSSQAIHALTKIEKLDTRQDELEGWRDRLGGAWKVVATLASVSLAIALSSLGVVVSHYF